MKSLKRVYKNLMSERATLTPNADGLDFNSIDIYSSAISKYIDRLYSMYNEDSSFKAKIESGLKENVNKEYTVKTVYDIGSYDTRVRLSYETLISYIYFLKIMGEITDSDIVDALPKVQIGLPNFLESFISASNNPAADEKSIVAAGAKRKLKNIFFENDSAGPLTEDTFDVESLKELRKQYFENAESQNDSLTGKVISAASLDDFKDALFNFVYFKVTNDSIRLSRSDSDSDSEYASLSVHRLFGVKLKDLIDKTQTSMTVSIGTLFEEILRKYFYKALEREYDAATVDLNHKSKKVSIALIMACNGFFQNNSGLPESQVYSAINKGNEPSLDNFKHDFIKCIRIDPDGSRKLNTEVARIKDNYKKLLGINSNSDLYIEDYEKDSIFCDDSMSEYKSNSPFDFIARHNEFREDNNIPPSIGLFDLKCSNKDVSGQRPIGKASTGSNGGTQNSALTYLNRMLNVGRTIKGDDFNIAFLGLIQIIYKIDYSPNNKFELEIVSGKLANDETKTTQHSDITDIIAPARISAENSINKTDFYLFDDDTEDGRVSKASRFNINLNDSNNEATIKLLLGKAIKARDPLNFKVIKKQKAESLEKEVQEKIDSLYKEYTSVENYINDVNISTANLNSKIKIFIKPEYLDVLSHIKDNSTVEFTESATQLNNDFSNIKKVLTHLSEFVTTESNLELADPNMFTERYKKIIGKDRKKNFRKSMVKLFLSNIAQDEESKVNDDTIAEQRQNNLIVNINSFLSSKEDCNYKLTKKDNATKDITSLNKRYFNINSSDSIPDGVTLKSIIIDYVKSITENEDNPVEDEEAQVYDSSNRVSNRTKRQRIKKVLNSFKRADPEDYLDIDYNSFKEGLLVRGQTLLEVYSNLYKKSLIVEGGLGGHMMHPYEMLDSTPREMINQIKRYSLPQSIVEKVDGQNLFFTVERDGTLLFARNKEDMTHDDLIEKFKGHGAEKAFVEGGNAIKSGVEQGLTGREEEVTAIFHPSEDVRSFINFEIMHPEKPNQIRYDQKYIVFHSIVDYKEGRVQVGSSSTDERIASLINLIRSGIESSGFILASNQTVDLNSLEDVQISEYKDRIMDASSALRISDDQTFADGIMNMISDELQAEGVVISDEALSILRDYVIYGEDESGRKIHSKEFTKIISKEDAAKLRSLGLTTSTKVMSKIGRILMPFKDIFVDLGIDLLKGVKSSYMSDDYHQQNIEDIKDKLQTAINDIDRYTSEVAEENWSNVIIRLMPHVRKVKQKGIENIVASSVEGGVYSHDDNLMKLTGGFAPMNQIVGAAYRDNEGIFTEFNSKFKKIESVKRSLKGVFSLIF